MSLKNPLPGVAVSKSNFHLHKESFGCCGGLGSYLVKDRNVTESCSLKQRITRLNLLSTQFFKTWSHLGFSLKDVLSKTISVGEFNGLRESLTGFSGQIFTRPAIDKGPNLPLWLKAMVMEYRLGTPVYWVTLGSDKGRPYANERIIFVEGARKLWDPRISYDFEEVIDLSYRTLTPLCLDLITYEGSDHPSHGAFAGGQREKGPLSSLERKIARLKSRPPLDWLSKDLRYRLSTVCLGTAKFCRRGAAIRSKSKDGRLLPW